ncbi:TetR family transcriptional regulator C-terminal domain-containing protein [Streptomyces sp. AC154]|uniref:TetR family transcriptional regulator C-terminal domain-containing protein n=1 Tax=Streptomyces sp. AC154 TaxID=3143184 RepID=UPI003F821549
MQHDEAAERVRQVIRNAGVSQREFARRMVIDPSKLSRSLGGTRRFSAAELARVADIAGVDVGWLLGTQSEQGAAPSAQTGAPLPAARPRRVRNAAAGRPATADSGRPLQIVQQTVRLIAEHGFHSVRVSDIAEACGTSTAAIHYHFPGRDELLEAAARWCMDEDTARRAAGTADTDHAGDELRLLIELQTPYTPQQRRQWSVWLDLWAEAARSTAVGALHVEYYRQWRATVAEVIGRGVAQEVFRPVDPEAAAIGLTALIDGLATQVLATTPGEPGTSAEDMHGALLRYVDATLTAG